MLVPFDIITNSSTRTHLLRLPRLETLDLLFSGIALPMAQFLASLTHLKSLTLRAPTIAPYILEPFETSTQPLEKLEVYLTRVLPDDEIDTLRTALRHSDRLGPICIIFMGPPDSRQVLYAPTEEAALALVAERDRQNAKTAENKERWERTTKLKLLGGLINLTMESRS